MITSSYLITTPTLLVQGTATESKAITVGYFCNQASFEVFVNVYVVPAGSTTVANHKIYNTLSVPALDTVIIDTEKLVLGDGDALWADCSLDNSIVSTISSVGI